MKYGFVIDNRKCIGCHACTVACKSEHDVPIGVNRTWVKQVEKGTFPDSRRLFSVMRCNHCTDAPCVEICPVEALYIRDDGIVDFDNDRCIGCKASIPHRSRIWRLRSRRLLRGWTRRYPGSCALPPVLSVVFGHPSHRGSPLFAACGLRARAACWTLPILSRRTMAALSCSMESRSRRSIRARARLSRTS